MFTEDIIGKFVQEAFKQEFPKAETTPSLQNKMVKKQYRQPNEKDCGLFVLAQVIQLVRKTGQGYVMGMGEYTWVCEWVSGWVCEGVGVSGSAGYSGSGLKG